MRDWWKKPSVTVQEINNDNKYYVNGMQWLVTLHALPINSNFTFNFARIYVAKITDEPQRFKTYVVNTPNLTDDGFELLKLQQSGNSVDFPHHLHWYSQLVVTAVGGFAWLTTSIWLYFNSTTHARLMRLSMFCLHRLLCRVEVIYRNVFTHESSYRNSVTAAALIHSHNSCPVFCIPFNWVTIWSMTIRSMRSEDSGYKIKKLNIETLSVAVDWLSTEPSVLP